MGGGGQVFLSKITNIMVLALPRLPVDPDDSSNKYFKFYMRVDTPWGMLLLKFDTTGIQEQEQLHSQHCISKIFKMQYLHI